MKRPLARELGWLVLLAVGACHCEPNTLEPSLNTVDPATHEPYQQRQPKTSGRPIYDAGISSDRPSTEPNR